MSHPAAKQAPNQLVTPVTIFGNLAFVSGQLPRQNGALKYTGRVGADVSAEDAQHAAALCAQACLDSLALALGGYERIVRILKITGFVASTPDFVGQGAVIDGASRVFIDVLGERGKHARSAIGVQQLPHGAAVEVEMIVGLV
ncbi:LysR family transcriptional regulator [Burkholderia sp. Leaf177]|uniref:RidA family protein n=1 Tax=Burkholderia sp. Leaf177 TaxID=1736287 RepID=UPI0006FEFA39|nr:RidA family protein [Burkholderia sp. Leaf177]KQR77196.1 LysR family transcriptional regulator [Burkholderia sp. Leaf177]